MSVVHLFGAAAIGVSAWWVAMVWWPRHAAAWRAPKEVRTGRRISLRLRAVSLEPVSAGIVPGRTILGRRRGRFVQARHRIHTLIVGPPQVGKTRGMIIPNVLAWPGSVIVTTTKRDVLDACANVRAYRGTVWCFDPLGVVGPLPPGVRRLAWSPLRDCTDWDVALRRAGALAVDAGRGSEDGSHWRDRGTQLLATLLHAAALAGHPMSTVCTWIHSGAAEPVHAILTEHRAGHGLTRLAGVMNTAPRERASIWSAVAGILRPFDSQAILESADLASGCCFDAAEFLAEPNTIFVVAPADAHVDLAAVVVGMVEEVRSAALRISDQQGRLPTPLLLALDEVANICPLPSLPAILAEGGGRNITLVLALQDLSQAAGRWGADFGQGLLTLCGAKVVLPGIANAETLRILETLCGTHRVRRTTRSESTVPRRPLIPGPGRVAEVTHVASAAEVEEPVMPAAAIRELRVGTALCVVQEERARIVRLALYDHVRPFATWSAMSPPAWTHLDGDAAGESTDTRTGHDECSEQVSPLPGTPARRARPMGLSRAIRASGDAGVMRGAVSTSALGAAWASAVRPIRSRHWPRRDQRGPPMT